MQMCLGATYSWSVYVQPIKEILNLQQGPAQIPFTVFYFVFPLTMIFAGNFLPVIGPRMSGMIGGFLFGAGWILASFGDSSFIFTVLGIGALSGIGAGMAYIVPIAVCVQWFPKSKGLVTGIAVAGFGGGAALVSQIGGLLMESFGKTPFQTFFIFGAFFLIIICSSASTMCFPKSYNVRRSSQHLSFSELATHPIFMILYAAMFIGLAAGFAVNANLKELFPDSADVVNLGVMAVSLFAIANATGRISWGIVFDRVKSATAIKTNLIFQAITLICAPSLLESSTGFLVFAFLTGLNYGGVLVIYASTTSRCWGPDQVGKAYSLLFSSNIPASFAPLVAGLIFDTFQSFNIAMYGLAALLVIGTILVHYRSGVINTDRSQVTSSLSHTSHNSR